MKKPTFKRDKATDLMQKRAEELGELAPVVEGHSFDGVPFCIACMPPGAELDLPGETDVRPLDGVHSCDSCGDLCGRRS